MFASLELCEGRTDNVVIIDWSKYSGANSTFTIETAFFKTIEIFQNSEKIGRLLANCIEKLVNAGLKEDEIWLIGFSLGTNISGFPGKCSNISHKVFRITGT